MLVEHRDDGDPFEPIHEVDGRSSPARFSVQTGSEGLPRFSLVRIPLEFRQALVQDLSVPSRDRHALRASGNDVPKGLHVVDLFLNWQIREARWRKFERLGHLANLPQGSHDFRGSPPKTAAFRR